MPKQEIGCRSNVGDSFVVVERVDSEWLNRRVCENYWLYYVN